jgi:hypothetical protein
VRKSKSCGFVEALNDDQAAFRNLVADLRDFLVAGIVETINCRLVTRKREDCDEWKTTALRNYRLLKSQAAC